MVLSFFDARWWWSAAALVVVSCGGRVFVDDEAGLSSGAAVGSGGSSASSSPASSGAGGDVPPYPCSAPTGPGLTSGETCLQVVPASGCPPMDSPELAAALFAQLLEECEASLSSCCPVDVSVRCGPNPAPAQPGACCYITLAAAPPDGTCL